MDDKYLCKFCSYIGNCDYPREEYCEQYSELINRKPTKRTTLSPYERTRAAVYATGNKWAIENFNATH